MRGLVSQRVRFPPRFLLDWLFRVPKRIPSHGTTPLLASSCNGLLSPANFTDIRDGFSASSKTFLARFTQGLITGHSKIHSLTFHAPFHRALHFRLLPLWLNPLGPFPRPIPADSQRQGPLKIDQCLILSQPFGRPCGSLPTVHRLCSPNLFLVPFTRPI